MKETRGDKTELLPTLDSNSNQEEQIAHRAYELWQQRGSAYGDDWADWFQAEIEIKLTTEKD